MRQNLNQDLAILRLPQVEQRTGLSRSTLYQYMKDGYFPKPVPLGPRAVGWLESDVGDWIATRVQIARNGGANPTS
jgi:prophage regulatory protein